MTTKVINLPGQLGFRVVRDGRSTVEMFGHCGTKLISRKDCAAIIKGLRAARAWAANLR